MTISAIFYNPSNLSEVAVGGQAPVKLLFGAFPVKDNLPRSLSGHSAATRGFFFSTVNFRIHTARTAGK